MADETPQDEVSASVAEPQPAAEETDGAEGDKKPPKLVQTVEMKDIGPCKKHIKVTVDRGSVDARLNGKFSELVVDANVSGFRPGKAPRKIIEKRFHKEVSDQVKAEVLLESLEQLAEENDIAPLSAPNIDPLGLEIPKEGPFIYEFDVEVRPDFDLPTYKGLKIKRPVREFTEEDVAREERRLLAPHGKLIDKQGGAEDGDILVTDVTSRDGERVLSEIKSTSVRIEPRLAFKDGVAEGFSDQVRGVKAGDSRVVDVKLSTGVADESLRGKTVKATFQVKEVKAQVLPELTHEFLHKFGVHTPDQLHELVRVVLQRRLEYQQRQAAREQVMDQLAANANWDLPEELLLRQARKAMMRRAMEMRAEGISEEEISGRLRLLQQDILRNTASALKEHFVLQKIAEDEKIDIDEDDLDAEIDRIADQNNESPRKVRARLEKDDLMDALAAEIIERRALDLILESAEYEDVPFAKEEGAVTTMEEQTVPGEMNDPVASPPPEPSATPSQE
jgi:trigger factor